MNECAWDGVRTSGASHLVWQETGIISIIVHDLSLLLQHGEDLTIPIATQADGIEK